KPGDDARRNPLHHGDDGHPAGPVGRSLPNGVLIPPRRSMIRDEGAMRQMAMKYGTVAGVDKPVSRLVQGTIPLTEDDVPGSFALLDAVYEHGCRTFDTAHGYGSGACERVLGAWYNDRGVRDEIVVLGKGAHP